LITRITCLRIGMEMRRNASDPEGPECLIKRAVKAARAGDIGAGDIGTEAEIWGDGGRSRGWKVRLRESGELTDWELAVWRGGGRNTVFEIQAVWRGGGRKTAFEIQAWLNSGRGGSNRKGRGRSDREAQLGNAFKMYP